MNYLKILYFTLVVTHFFKLFLSPEARLSYICIVCDCLFIIVDFCSHTFIHTICVARDITIFFNIDGWKCQICGGE